MNKDFPLQNNASPVGILSSVPRTLHQDCSFLRTHFPAAGYQDRSMCLLSLKFACKVSVAKRNFFR